MADISRVAMFGKLNPIAYQSIESASVFCRMRGNPYVELNHWLHQILQLPASDAHLLVKAFDLNPGVLAKDLVASLDRLPRGASSVMDLSAQVDLAVERAWVYGSLMFGATNVRTGHLILGCLKTPALASTLAGYSREFLKIGADALAERFAATLAGSPEDALGAQDGAPAPAGETSGAIAPAAMGKEEALKRFTVDLTEKAASGKFDPIVGRDAEIRQMVDILLRRRQNNPLLTGEAGVGKTAVVEGLAQRIASGDAPAPLKGVRLLSLDIGLLQAGASMKGEFEQRLKSIIEEVETSPKPIILFIDEVHTLIGAGGAAGTGDAANLLKPALARGTLRTVAATTWAEYKKHIEKDPALTRRFQVVTVGEPDEEAAILMMRGVVGALERHHKVQVLDDALVAAVRYSHRYVPARQLPDKSLSLLDTACARTAVSWNAPPAEVEAATRLLEALTTESGIIERERSIGVDVDARRADVEKRLKEAAAAAAEVNKKWSAERMIAEKIAAIHRRIRESATKDGAPADPQLIADLAAANRELAEVQGDNPYISPLVDRQAVAKIVQEWTGVPVARMMKDEVQSILNLPETLAKRVVGQDHAMRMIASRVQTSRAGLDNPTKPVGVFMLCGPSGVGKTETALALADALYGGERNVITINMSEFQEAHTVSTLKGAPPGYVGYGEGGVLTEAVRRRPYSVVLLDEVEKAHSDVHEIFFQVFDKGLMEDGEGRLIDFKNTLILLTSNVGSDLIINMYKDEDLVPDPESLATALRPQLLKVFPAALLGRLIVIPYRPLSDPMLRQIIDMQLARIKKRIETTRNIPVRFDDSVVTLIASRCNEVESGGRIVDAILTNTMLPSISREFLTRVMTGRPATGLFVEAKDGEFRFDFDAARAAP